MVMFSAAALALALAATSPPLSGVDGHGLMYNPPSRNWYCGVITKPDHVANGGGTYPECSDAFDYGPTFETGYQFMSVLTHAPGHVAADSTHVCSFDSESWSGQATPWDAPLDNWPTSSIMSGEQYLGWNIAWGTHFDDTEEFRYWITKEDFVYPGSSRELTWADFEDDPFCVEFYSDQSPSANPNVIPDKDATTFDVLCDVPSRSGRHVIYGEWGRTPSTYERFHGCIDVEIMPLVTGPTVSITRSPSNETISGPEIVTLDGSGSTGDSALTYSWDITEGEGATLSSQDQAMTTLTLTDPSMIQTVMVTLTLTDEEGAVSSDSISFGHLPDGYVPSWQSFGSELPEATQPWGTELQILVNFDDGTQGYYPSVPYVVDASDTGAADWPTALNDAIQAEDPDALAAVGVLDLVADAVSPQPTGNKIYVAVAANALFAELQITAAPSGPCDISLQEGCNAYYCNIEVGTDGFPTVLDFTNSQLDLSALQAVSGHDFPGMTVSGDIITLTAAHGPGSVSLTSPGQIGLQPNGQNSALGNLDPTTIGCVTPYAGTPTAPSPGTPPATPAPTPPSTPTGPAPATSPPTISPTPSPTEAAGSGSGCCSGTFKYCDKPGWCSNDSSNCGTCQGEWLPDGEVTGCNGLWEGPCDGASDPGCCSGAQCTVYGPGNSQCTPA